MKKPTKILTALIAVAMGLALASTSGFATTRHEATKAQPVARPLYNFVPPSQFPAIQLPPPNAGAVRLGGPSAPNFNNQAWPGGMPTRY